MNAAVTRFLVKIGFATEVSSVNQQPRTQRVVKGTLPADEAEFRERFFSRKDEDEKEPTQFQKRMQSGGY